MSNWMYSLLGQAAYRRPDVARIAQLLRRAPAMLRHACGMDKFLIRLLKTSYP